MGLNACLRLLRKTGMAAAAGNGNDTLAAAKAEPGLAAGTFEVLVGLAILKTNLGLTALGLFLFGHGDIAAVFSAALFDVA